MDSLTQALDYLVIGSLVLLSLALVGLAMAASQLIPQVNRTLTAYEKLASTLDTELAPTIREVNRLAGGVIKLQSAAQHSVAEVGTKVEDVTGNITKVADSARKESSVWGTGFLAGVKAYLSTHGKGNESPGQEGKSKERSGSDAKHLTMDRGEENVGLKR
ncbi:MAG TPA: hypothetical protein V6D17_12125 [Candidatus Obscuribacterales bacterium]